MANMSPLARNEFLTDLGLVAEAVRAGVNRTYTIKKDGHWKLWLEYCQRINIDPFFDGISDPVPYLQVFTHRFRHGRIAPRGQPVKAAAATDALRLVGQAFSSMGTHNPRLNAFVKTDFWLQRQLRSYRKQDAPPKKVKPLPVCIVREILLHAFQNQSD